MPTKIVCQEEWISHRKKLLEKEKAATRANDALRSELRDFPMTIISKKYIFNSPGGHVNLEDLFAGRKQLIVYHFMLSPDEESGCTGCSFLVDNLPSSLEHLHSRNTTLMLVSRAPITTIEKFKKRMGWTFPWYSSFGSDFNYDFNVSFDNEIGAKMYNFDEIARPCIEMPGLSVFLKESSQVFHTYSVYARGLDHLLATNGLLDLTPLGRQTKKNGDNPEWKLHDEYEDGSKYM